MEKYLQKIGGLYVSKNFSTEAVQSAMNYKARPGDIFVASYPKCGTTWLQKIVLSILRKGKPSNDPLDMFFACPYLELSGVEALDSTPKPLAIKTHLPYHLVPLSKDAKYIYVCRYPMDCAISYYYHLRTSFDFDLTFDEYLESFFSDVIPYGNCMNHMIGWYEHKDDANVHFVTYETIKKDPKKEILKIAKFIGKEYWELMAKNPKVLDDIVLYSSFDYMKKDTNEMMNKFWRGEMDAGDRVIPKGLRETLEFRKKINQSQDSKADFLRKGVVGDWKNHLSPEQKRLYQEKVAERAANTDIMNLWK